MDADDGRFDDDVFEVRIVGHGEKYPLPDAFLAPAAEPAEGAASVAENLGEITPRRAGAHDPEDVLDKHPVIRTGRAALIRPADDQS
jgi:hypothetical protein